jgi:hypothetical protein
MGRENMNPTTVVSAVNYSLKTIFFMHYYPHCHWLLGYPCSNTCFWNLISAIQTIQTFWFTFFYITLFRCYRVWREENNHKKQKKNKKCIPFNNCCQCQRRQWSIFPLESATDDTNNQFDIGGERLGVKIFRTFVKKNWNDNE